MARSGRAAIVIDDVLPPWQPRGIEIRGSAEAVGGDNPRIRIRPERIFAWGMAGSAGAHNVTPKALRKKPLDRTDALEQIQTRRLMNKPPGDQRPDASGAIQTTE